MPGAEQRARAFMRPMGVENADRWASAPGRSIMGAVTEKKITLNHWDAEAFLAIE